MGANGSGKTSLLEAVYLLGHGRSFKSSITGRIIQHEHPELFVHGRLDTLSGMPLPIGINKRRDGTTEVKIAGQSGQKLAELAQVLPLQLIHPEGFDLLTDGPKHRRALLIGACSIVNRDSMRCGGVSSVLTSNAMRFLKRPQAIMS
ncbi:DNA recombination and repair protein recF [Vibrio ishigakensis]|uniref:DNA recombination and repair protein recF n=1 Tax=Vibrio ishigakensis TaxID=1481914 RepID=A0A0B8NLC1_9VIBR|nr:DNA recombination and repair protein recF [Vibrio ishigakensis]